MACIHAMVSMEEIAIKAGDLSYYLKQIEAFQESEKLTPSGGSR